MANTKVTSRVLANDAVLTANIADDQVTTAKIADDVALGGNPTTTTQTAGNNTTRIATTAFVTTAVANIVDSAPDALNTLNELAAAMGDDANFSTTITNSIAAKLPLAGGTMTGNIVMGDDTSIGIADDAERIEFDGAGDISLLGANVGIGTTSPSTLLHLGGTAPGDSIIRQDSTSSGTNWEIGEREAGKWQIFEDDSDSIVATFKSDGKVGIGTTDPTAPLHVTRTASGYPILKLTQNGADQYNTIYLQNSNSTAATVVMGTGGSSVTNTSWANSAVFGTTSDAKVVLLQNDSAAVTVDTNQNVGIGQTSNLNARLNVTVDSGNEGIQVYRAFGGNGGGYNGVAFAMGNSASASNVHVYSSIVPNIISNTDGSEDGSIAFYTSLSGTNAEKMRLNNNGQLLLGTTSNNSDTYKMVADLGGGSKGIDVRGISYNANNGAFRSVPSGNTTYLFAAMLNSSNSTVGSIVVTSADTTYNTSSDYRLKENITPLENGLDRLNQLKPVNFNWIESGKEDEGFIAHEVKEVFPYAVTGEKDAVNEEGKIQGQQMDYGRITPLLVKAIQEQQEQIETLKKEVEELKGG